ncbi:DUF4235 domain-containing protein [Sanguibacter sp. A247]|uniref:DUF4235 domain-containing protein n=1 Tax=unclassified Sanguibacter TaxID=2645534 RepID=UPI003FD6EEDB
MADQEKEALLEKVILLGASAGAAWIAQRGLSYAWKKATGKDAPRNALDTDAPNTSIIVFAAITGAVAAAAKIAADRGARRVAARVVAGRKLHP